MKDVFVPSGGGVNVSQPIHTYLPSILSLFSVLYQHIQIDKNYKFRVYEGGGPKSISNPMPASLVPVLVLLHGGGHSALSWAIAASLMKSDTLR